MAVEGLEDITYLTISSRSLIRTKVKSVVAAAIVIEEELGLNIVLDLENPPLGLGGRVGQCSRIWAKSMTISAFYSRAKIMAGNVNPDRRKGSASAPAKNHHWPVRNQPSHDIHVYEELVEVKLANGNVMS
uniref:Uncharacterized protein n=1 Tax=Salix viminalis TaxID=40686 RepID=A0A6N2MZE9_SALVM